MLPGGTPTTAAQRNATTHRLYLPLVLTPPPPIEIVDVYTSGGRYGIRYKNTALRNNTTTTICNIRVGYGLTTSSNAIVVEQSSFPVVFPAETVHFSESFIDWEDIVSYQATVSEWHSEHCPYAQLTPVSQEVTQTDAYSVSITGTIRNDTATTLTNIVVMLSPGVYKSSQVVQVMPTTLDPGGVGTYSGGMFFPHAPYLPTSFDVRAYGSSASLGQ